MRLLKTSLILAAFVVLLFEADLLQAQGERSITGRLIFDNVDMTCEQQCVVTLMGFGVRPVQSVLADLGGRFTFDGVPRGMYSIKVEVEGFESVIHPAQELDGFGLNILVPLVRKSAPTSSGSDVVNVSEFLSRYPKKAVSLFEKGTESLKNKKNDEAVKYLRHAVELAPTFYQAHYQLGMAYREVGRLQDAEHEFVKAHQLNGTAVEPLLNLTKLYLEQNDTERAVTTGERAVKADSRSAPAFLGLGVALYKAAQLDRAEAVLKRALALAPKMGNVRLMLANVYLKLRRYDNTLEQLNSYIAENPKGPQLQDALAVRDKVLQAKSAERP